MPISDAISRAFTDTGGAAGVEFALMAPALILFAIGTIDVGALAYEKAEVAAAVHAGAYYAMMNGANVTAIQSAVTGATPLSIPADNVTVTAGFACSGASSITLTTTAPTCATGNVASYVQISASATYTPLVSWSPLSMPTTLSDSALVRTS